MCSNSTGDKGGGGDHRGGFRLGLMSALGGSPGRYRVKGSVCTAAGRASAGSL